MKEEKSSLTPSHSVKYIGFLWDSVKMMVTFPQKKIESIIEDASKAFSKTSIQAHDLEVLLGKLNSIRFVFPQTLLFLRGLQRLQKGPQAEAWSQERQKACFVVS